MFSGTATSMLMPETLDMMRLTVEGCSLCTENFWSPMLHHHMASTPQQSHRPQQTAHLCCSLQMATTL